MSSVRSVHTATLLQDGRVLIVGGYGSTGVTPSSDVYCASVVAGICPVTGFNSVGSLAAGRANHTSTLLLADGWVLAAGGTDGPNALATSQLFDPTLNLFEIGAPMATPRSGHAATRLPDGRVLVTGGRDALPGVVLKSAELYNGP
jgi:hypothetical protein